jgi:hypothetical protein
MVTKRSGSGPGEQRGVTIRFDDWPARTFDDEFSVARVITERRNFGEAPSAECFTDSGAGVKTCDEIGSILRIPCTLRPRAYQGGYVVTFPDTPPAITQGDTRDDTLGERDQRVNANATLPRQD